MAKKTKRSTSGGRKTPASVTASAARRDLSPVELANEVVTRTRLRRVRFCEFSAQAKVSIDSMGDDVHLQASTNFSRPTVDTQGDRAGAGFRATSALMFRLSRRLPLDQGDEREPCVVVKATLEASYAFKDDTPDFSEEQLKTFALHYCPFHVWGYWREFVHSSLARLEFPTLTVPLFQIDMAQALVFDEVD